MIDTIESENLVARAASLGDKLFTGFRDQLAEVAGVKAIRGFGLMIGIELERECTELPRLALEKGLLINVTAGKVIRLLPPLIISDEQATRIVNDVSALVKSFLTP